MGEMPFGLKLAVINRAFRKKLDEKASAMGLTAVQLRVLGSVSRLEAAGETEIHQNDLEPASGKQGFHPVCSQRPGPEVQEDHLHGAVGRNPQHDPETG